MCLSADLFNLYNAILREQEILQGCITGSYNPDNIRYTDCLVLIADTETRIYEILQKGKPEERSKY